MVTVIVGSDTYGAVKKVGSTPVVTRFAMLSFFPLFPLESYYFAGFGQSISTGIPLHLHVHSTTIKGIPLARIDKLSVILTYLRGLSGAMVIIGFLAMIPGIMWFTGEHLDQLAVTILKGLILCFVMGVVLGLCSYLFPFQMSRREKEIRRHCGTVLGICADPAKVRPDDARWLEETLDRSSVGHDLLVQLVQVRVQMAHGGPDRPLEDRTDDLLERLRLQEIVSA